jgi:hypothetical protein
MKRLLFLSTLLVVFVGVFFMQAFKENEVAMKLRSLSLLAILLFSACDPEGTSNSVVEPVQYSQKDLPECVERQKIVFQKSDLKFVNNLSDLLDILLRSKSDKNSYPICSPG